MGNEKERLWEGRVWTAAQLFMSAAVLWGASTLWDLSKTVARIDERLSYALMSQTAMANAQVARDAGQDASIEKLRIILDKLEDRTKR